MAENMSYSLWYLHRPANKEISWTQENKNNVMKRDFWLVIYRSTITICQAVCRAGMRGKLFRRNCLTVTHSFNPGSSARATWKWIDMINANRPIINLDLDLLRTFVAVADLNTFAAAAAAVCRTQSAVSQQMQRLEQLVGKELFARHGRNKLLTEHGIQLLGYARKILRFNDEACSSLMFNNLQGV